MKINTKEVLDIIGEAVSKEPIDCTNCDGTGKTGDKDCLVCHGTGKISINEAIGSPSGQHPFHQTLHRFGYNYSTDIAVKFGNGEPGVKYVYTKPGGPDIRVWSMRGQNYWSVSDSKTDTGNLLFSLDQRLAALAVESFEKHGFKLGSETDKGITARNESVDHETASIILSTLNEGIAYTDTDRERLQQSLSAHFPYVAVHRSTLGGEGRASLMVVVSADKKEDWSNGILENSRYCRFHVIDGKVEAFSGGSPRDGWGKMRKSAVKDVGAAAAKIISWSPGLKEGSNFPGLGLATGIASGISQGADMVKRKLGIKPKSDKDKDARWTAAKAQGAKDDARRAEKVKAAGGQEAYAKAYQDKAKATVAKNKAKRDAFKRDRVGKFA